MNDLTISGIEMSEDEAWLKEARLQLTALIEAIDARLAKLKFHNSIASVPVGLNLGERVWETVRVYEAYLALKHRKNVRATRTRQMIAKWGEKEAVRRTVHNMQTSSGLELLAKYNRLDCSYEQIILDFSKEFDLALRLKAKRNLDQLPVR
jgi:hypothetical protein